MLGRTHATSGAVAVMALVPVMRSRGMVIEGWDLPMVAVVAAGAAMLPDLDHQHATVARSVWPVTRFLAEVVGTLFGGHRNGTHSLVGVAAFTALAWWIAGLGGVPLAIFLAFLAAVASAAMHMRLSRFALVHTLTCLGLGALLARGSMLELFDAALVPYAVAIGCLAHIVGDMATPQGCPLLWPVATFRFRYAGISTGHVTERLVVGPVLGCIALILLFSFTEDYEGVTRWWSTAWTPFAGH